MARPLRDVCKIHEDENLWRAGRGAATGELDFMDVWHLIQVKQKDKVGHPDIDGFFRKP